MSERGWIILFSVLCVLSTVLTLASWCHGDVRLAVEFSMSIGASFIALVAAIHQATKEGR